MTRGDLYHKDILSAILSEGCMDKNPRPHYEDGEPAHTLSINHVVHQYDISKNEDILELIYFIKAQSAIKNIKISLNKTNR